MFGVINYIDPSYYGPQMNTHLFKMDPLYFLYTKDTRLYVCSLHKSKMYSGHCSTPLKYIYHIVTPNFVPQRLSYKTVLIFVKAEKRERWGNSFVGLRTKCSSTMLKKKKVGLQQGTVFALWVEHALLISQLILTDPVKREREKQANIFSNKSKCLVKTKYL